MKTLPSRLLLVIALCAVFGRITPGMAEEVLTADQIRGYLSNPGEASSKVKITKWRDDLKVFVLAKSDTKLMSPALMENLSRMAAASGLQIVSVTSENEANVLIEEQTTDVASSEGLTWLYRDDSAQLPKVQQTIKKAPMFNRVQCNHLKITEQSYITQAVILVPSAQFRDDNKACAARSLFKILGMRGDTVIGWESILDPSKTEITPADEAILRILYNKDFPTGGSLSQLTAQ